MNKKFYFTTKRINTVADLKAWCEWLLAAGYEDATVSVNCEYDLKIFDSTEITINSENEAHVDLG